MGKDKSTTTTTTQATPTAAELEMQNLQLAQYKQTEPLQTEMEKTYLQQLINLGTGAQLSPYFAAAGKQISPEAIGAQATELTRQNMPGFQQLGLGTSGVAFRETSKDIANQLLFPVEQFNIGASQNLLNLAFGGQAQVQSPIVAQQNTLSNQLAGLRSVTSNQTQTSMNPFLKSFQTSLGSTLGSPAFKWGNMTF